MSRRLPPGIYRTRSGYRAAVEVRPLPRVERRFKRHVGIATIKAWREETQQRLRLARSQIRPLASGTLAADVERYRPFLRDLHPHTRQQREQHLRRWVALFGERLRASLTTAEIHLALQHWPGRPAPATRNKIRMALFRVYAVLDRGTGRPNPVRDVPTARTPALEPRGLPYDLVIRILQAMPLSYADGRWNKARARLTVIAWTGLRPSELMRVRPEDWQGETLLVRTAKGGRMATLPLLPHAQLALQRLDAMDGWGRYTTAAVSHAFRRALKRAGLPELVGKCKPYDLRHSFGSLVYRTTGDIEATRGLLRHSTLRMTQRYIQSAVPDRLKAALDGVQTALVTRSLPRTAPRTAADNVRQPPTFPDTSPPDA